MCINIISLIKMNFFESDEWAEEGAWHPHEWTNSDKKETEEKDLIQNI